MKNPTVNAKIYINEFIAYYAVFFELYNQNINESVNYINDAKYIEDSIH